MLDFNTNISIYERIWSKNNYKYLFCMTYISPSTASTLSTNYLYIYISII